MVARDSNDRPFFAEQELSMNTEATVNQRGIVLWMTYLIFFAILNETVFNVSTPKIAEQFSLNASGVSWVMTIFLVFFGIGSVIYGRLSDIFSARKLLVIGILIYNLGSILGFVFQSSYPMVILARAIQGIGGSALPALIFVVIAKYIAVAERGKIFGFITSIVSIAIGLGPVIGGFISGTFHWAFLFLIPLLVLIAIPFLKNVLPEETPRAGTIDLVGAGLVALTVGGLIVYLNYSQWYFLLAFLGFLIAFIVWIRTAPHPFIEPSLFANTKFRNSLIIGFSLFSIVIGIQFLIPLMLHQIHHLETNQIGLVLFPGAISSVVFGPIAGTLSDKRGSNFVVTLGLTLLVFSLVLMSFLLGISPIAVGAAMLFTFIGFTLFQTAMVNSVSQTLLPHETGVGMGLFNLVSIISGAVGTALVGKILDSGWFAFSLFSSGVVPKHAAFSNLMLVFTVVVVWGGILYLRSYRSTSSNSRNNTVPEIS
jgi:MFS transporter, DHA2 family, metal-tetracycline-proton antiporter